MAPEIRKHVPHCDHDEIDPVEFDRVKRGLEQLDHHEYGRVTKLEARVDLHDEERLRRLGAAWVLLVINGVICFLAAIAAIYSVMK